MMGETFFLFLFFGESEGHGLIMRTEFAQLREHYKTGRAMPTGRIIGTTRSGYPKYETVFRQGVMTDLGELSEDDWERRARALIDRYGEWDLFQRLLNCACDGVWLRGSKEKERYALGLHMSRIFECPKWVLYTDFHAQE